MGGLSVSIPNGTGNGNGIGNAPSPGGARTAAARNSLISFLAISRSATPDASTPFGALIDRITIKVATTRSELSCRGDDGRSLLLAIDTNFLINSFMT